MASIIAARAIANNEVAWVAWRTDVERIPGCLGFHIVREYLNDDDSVREERPLAAYVAFEGQSNPDWLPQNTAVWPVQKFSWRDLTLRKRRDRAERRPDKDRVRYRIRAVGKYKNGLERVVPDQETHWDVKTRTRAPNTYKGDPIALGYLTEPAWSNPIDVTCERAPFHSTFTNGILATQFLVRVLEEDDNKIQPGELEGHLRKPEDWLRNYLAGDVIPTIRDFFARPGGVFHAALYELEDEELVALLLDNAERLRLILSDAGSGKDEDAEPNENGNQPTKYDTRNAPARAKLIKRSRKAGTSFSMQNRLFNGSGHIGHNKFVVHVGANGEPRAVLTGSTNWTWSGVAGQSNNCIVIEDKKIAQAFLDYWRRLEADKQPTPKPTSAKATGAGQGDELKQANRTFVESKSGDRTIEVWFSPNVPGKKQPPSGKAKKPAPPPPDMDRLFSLIRKARRAIFFAVFMPSRGGANSIVAEAIHLGLKDTSLEVIGAISDTQAMWGYEPSHTEKGKKIPAWSPHVYREGGVAVVRATAMTDREIGRPLGDFENDEVLTTGRAIIHDKVLVIDPHDPEHCVVAFGSHNMGYKASYSNDENLVIVRGHQPLAQAYATHVLDLYDHYRFRAIEAERHADEGADDGEEWDGFLSTNDKWQTTTSRRLSDYLTE